jgi:hypothetical protein
MTFDDEPTLPKLNNLATHTANCKKKSEGGYRRPTGPDHCKGNLTLWAWTQTSEGKLKYISMNVVEYKWMTNLVRENQRENSEVFPH